MHASPDIVYQTGKARSKENIGFIWKEGKRLRWIVAKSLSVQNAAARLVTGTRRRDHITPVLRQLHWLPVRQQVNFKLAVLVFKGLHGLATAL